MKLQTRVTEEPKMIGSSAMMVEFYKQIARIADASASVLIEGESGTGKELTARSLHSMSSRRDKPFVVVHCGAIPDNLLESELFGYEKGSFTGASHQYTGLLESAAGGTVLLDEITEMSPSLQGKLLRFMQSGEVRRLGAHEVGHFSVRVVAATNRNIDDDLKKGTFRSDLLYRFVVRLHMPPLREHKEDLPQLIESLLKKIGYPSVRISDEAMELLIAYDWPGNVRELQNVLEQTLLLSPFMVLLPEHLPERFRPKRDETLPLLPPLEEAERKQIIQALQALIERAARMRGLESLPELLEMTAFAQQPPVDQVAQLRAGLGHPLGAGKNRFGQNLRRRAGRGRAQVGGKVADGEINFMPDGGNNGEDGMENGARHNFLVEGP